MATASTEGRTDATERRSIVNGFDFTYDAYERLLKAGLSNGYDFLTVREYLDRAELPDRFLVLRHDVDRKPENALDLARIESALGVPSTYYFRTIDKTYRPDLIRAVESLGHEVGYHYEDMDRADGDRDAAHESFARNLAKVREVADVDTVCMHGNPLTAHDNRDMWDGERGFEAYDLLGEAYLSMDFTDVTYFSDTGRTWRDGSLKVKDHPVGESEKHVQVETTRELAELLYAREVSRACVLVHPNRWAGSAGELISEWTKDQAINAVKRGMNVL
ncbi:MULTISPECIES: hypothetical protein [Halostella]|uniref:hypothetical protein n=1 Tax=Halostella TaxID=1843185 RepID=UPI001F0383CD|nr:MULTISPECIES: hypothetical protein [Halostella]